VADDLSAGDDAARARLAGLGFATTAPVEDGFIGGWVPEQPALDVTVHAAGSASPVVAALADRLPPWLRGSSAPSHAALLWLAVICAACIGVTGWTVLHHRAATSYSAPPVASQPQLPLPTPTPATIVVDVGGRVRRPGLVTLPLGARVADALRAAGGALRRRDLLTLNLAARVTDGELLLVGMPAAATASGASGTDTGPVNLNTATVDQLEALPGIGPVLAQHIIDWRTAHGGFRTVEQLNDVSGIGDSTYADLAPLVTV